MNNINIYTFSIIQYSTIQFPNILIRSVLVAVCWIIVISTERSKNKDILSRYTEEQNCIKQNSKSLPRDVYISVNLKY